jgi:hypothetical protein
MLKKKIQKPFKKNKTLEKSWKETISSRNNRNYCRKQNYAEIFYSKQQQKKNKTEINSFITRKNQINELSDN